MPLARNCASISEREWDKLVNLVRENQVVPVIGPELLFSPEVSGGDNYYRYWGRELAQLHSMQEHEGGRLGLYDTANLLSSSMSQNDLAYDIDEIVRRRTLPIPEPLAKLTSISGFSLYVTTTIDHLMHNALEAAGRASGLEDISFAPGCAQSRIDLSSDFAYSHSTGLFHLFGASSSVDGSFAKTEDDLIDFSWSLLDKSYAPTNFYDYLQRKTLLMLGCSFPDWLGRFFIHALNAGRHEQRVNIYYVSDGCECGLQDYLGRRHAKVVADCSPADFVEELHRRWSITDATQSDANSASSPAESFKPGAVFLSYASEDREVVRTIRAQLEAANIDTWMDESALEPGEAFQNAIHENIRKAAFFVAIISKSLINRHGGGRFLWKEWKWAEDTWMERPRDDRYLQPLVIDDTPAGAPFIDSPYRDLHWACLEKGRLPQTLVDNLIRGIRQYRRTL